jgi:hypothetical protein
MQGGDNLLAADPAMHRSIKVKRLRVNNTHGPAIGAANAGATRDATRKRVEWRMVINLKWKLAGQKGLEWRRRRRKRKERKKKALGTDLVR